MKAVFRISFEDAIARGRVLRRYSVLQLTIWLFVVFVAACAWGAIPAGERTVLQNLYTSTNGAGWTDSTNWNGAAGTECNWFGVSCDLAGTHVVSIYLPSNNLVGTLPSLSALTFLQSFWFQNNQLTGSIPSLSGLTDLQAIVLNSNKLTGSIPSLDGLTNLLDIYIADNKLTGSIPSLSGLTKLVICDFSSNNLTGSIPQMSSLTNVQGFYINNNNLTGSIPSLTGLASLVDFSVNNNQLTGSIPSLSGLSNLRGFYANSNNLSGSIPPLSGLLNLQYLYVYSNQLTGPIPPLSGLLNLQYLYVYSNQLTGPTPLLSGLANLRGLGLNNNQLTGSIPSLTGLTNLEWISFSSNQLTGLIPSPSGLVNLLGFTLDNNQLTGSIPSLTGLAKLERFNVSGNRLTGAISSLTGLASLHVFTVENNYLSGNVPAVPSPNNLTFGQSHLCPNNLNAAASSAWDMATATTPWYQQCTAGPVRFSVNYDGNDNTGGSVPDTGNIYTTGSTVTVLGNTGGLEKSGFLFDGWNTATNGTGIPYVGGNSFTMGSSNVVLYAQWGVPAVRIHETGIGYPDIQDAYDHASDGDTIEARSGLHGQHLLFDNPISVRLIGGYDETFDTNSGTTVVGEKMEIRYGSIELANIIVQ